MTRKVNSGSSRCPRRFRGYALEPPFAVGPQRHGHFLSHADPGEALLGDIDPYLLFLELGDPGHRLPGGDHLACFGFQGGDYAVAVGPKFGVSQS